MIKTIQINENHIAEEETFTPDESSGKPGVPDMSFRNTTREALEILLGMGGQSNAEADQGIPGPSADGGEEEPEIITAARNLRSKLVKEGIL